MTERDTDFQMRFGSSRRDYTDILREDPKQLSSLTSALHSATVSRIGVISKFSHSL
jgi:hypothetical protein